MTDELSFDLHCLRVDVEELTKKNEDLEEKLLKLEAEILKIQETIHSKRNLKCTSLLLLF